MSRGHLLGSGVRLREGTPMGATWSSHRGTEGYNLQVQINASIYRYVREFILHEYIHMYVYVCVYI